jgi:EmrB/QacA subfamily drug resistance transporter
MSEDRRRWWVLAGACVGLFLLMLDSTVVNLALPAVQGDLGASDAELQWVVNAYLLVMAALTVTAGRLGDLLGRKRVFQAGMLVFMAGSIVSATAPSPIALVLGRIVQGFGGSALVSLSLAIVARAFSDHDRGQALGIWASVSAVALAIGPLLGGLLVDDLSWRWIFWLNLPVCAIGIAITAASAEESRDETAAPGIDVPGLVTIGLGLGLLVLALVQGGDWGWTSAATAGCLLAAIALLAAFWVLEHRVQQPIVDFALFRNGPYLGATAAGFALVGAFWVVMFYEPQYLQNVLGHSALAAGLLVLPITVPMILLSPFTGWLARAVGLRLLMSLGMAIGTGGLVVLTLVDTGASYGVLVCGYLLFGVSLGIVYATMSTAAMDSMPAEKAGIASGVLSMNRLLAGAVLLAVTGAVVKQLSRDRLADEISTRAHGVTTGERGELDGLLAGARSARAALADQPARVVGEIRAAAAEAFTFALGRALWIGVGVMAAGTVLTALLVRASGPAPQARPEIVEHRARRAHV